MCIIFDVFFFKVCAHKHSVFDSKAKQKTKDAKCAEITKAMRHSTAMV